jgi:hypothetical protein
MRDDDDDDDDDSRAKRHKETRELELLAIRSIMRTENGRAFMYRCLSNCGTYSDTFSIDTNQHIYNAGQRRHGLWLDGELKSAATDDYFKMLREAI